MDPVSLNHARGHLPDHGREATKEDSLSRKRLESDHAPGPFYSPTL